MKRGLNYEKEVISSLRYWLPEAYIYKFPNLKNSVAVPGDILMVVNDKLHCIECKSTKNSIAFNVKLIRPKQVELARKIVDNGGKYWLFISNRYCNRNISTFILDEYHAFGLTETYNNDELVNKTIKWSDIQDRSDFIVTRKEGIIQLKSWIDRCVKFNRLQVL